MSKNQKRLRYNNCVHIGNFKLQLYQKAVWDEQKGTVLNLQYIIVQPVNEHFSVEIYEHSSMFHCPVSYTHLTLPTICSV